MSGLVVGLVYALIAMGLMLLIRAAGVMNFAQGNMLAMGAYVGFVLMYRAGISSPLLQIFAGAAFFVVFGIVFCGVCFLPFKGSKWPQAMMVSTVGAGTVISQLCILLVSRLNEKMDPIIPGSMKIGGFVFQYQYFIVLIAAALMIAGVYLLFEKLYIGRIMSAAAQNKYAAVLIGIPATLTTVITFCIVSLMVGFAGWLIAPIYFVRVTLSTFQAKAFAAIVVGGYGSLKGSVVGGIVIGLIEAYSTYFSSIYRDVIVFCFLILVLVVRPQGFFQGVGWTEKA
jgi:branched-chain amino acid transport system permease protein